MYIKKKNAAMSQWLKSFLKTVLHLCKSKCWHQEHHSMVLKGWISLIVVGFFLPIHSTPVFCLHLSGIIKLPILGWSNNANIWRFWGFSFLYWLVWGGNIVTPVFRGRMLRLDTLVFLAARWCRSEGGKSREVKWKGPRQASNLLGKL